MPMNEYPKPIKRLLHEYTAKAYEGELKRALAGLDRSFTEWRAGTISSGELSHRIHQYETGPSRELFSRYNDGPQDMNVAHAIVTGSLPEGEVPAELLEALSQPLAFYRMLKARGDLREN